MTPNSAAPMDVAPPRTKKSGRVVAGAGGTRDEPTVIGYHGAIPSRDEYGFVKSVQRERHYIRALDAYAISDDALAVVRNLAPDVDRVVIAEQDTGDVLEYDARLFLDPDSYGQESNAVPDGILFSEGDPQTFAAEDAARKWSGLAHDVYLHGDPADDDEVPDSVSFERASSLDRGNNNNDTQSDGDGNGTDEDDTDSGSQGGFPKKYTDGQTTFTSFEEEEDT